MKRISMLMAMVGVFATTVELRAQHPDVRSRVASGQIVTDAWRDSTSTATPDVRVFGWDFQEDPTDPYFIPEPGFNSGGPTALPAGSQLRFNILASGVFGLPGTLSYWSGSGAVLFGAVPSGETLRLNRGAQSRTAGASSAAIEGFALKTAEADGSVHVHISTFLQGSDGNSDPLDGFLPAEGIYLVPIELTSSDATIAGSAPIFFVFNNGASEEVHDLAIDWVTENLVPIPEPSGMVLLAIGGAAAGLFGYRRRLGKRRG